MNYSISLRFVVSFAVSIVLYLVDPALVHADVLYNGVSQGNQAHMDDGVTVIGSGFTDGVVVESLGDSLTISGGVVDIGGADAVGLRVAGGSVNMFAGLIEARGLGNALGMLISEGNVDISGGVVSGGVQVQGPSSFLAISGGTIRDAGNLTVSNGGFLSIEGGLIYNARIVAVDTTSRIDIRGGRFFWVDALDGSEVHIFGSAFTIQNQPVEFIDSDSFRVPVDAGFMSSAFTDQSIAGFKLFQSNGGTITLHRVPEPSGMLGFTLVIATFLISSRSRSNKVRI